MMLNEDLLRDFEERIRLWESESTTGKKIADVIIKKGPYLKLYCVYIRDFSAMNFHFDECCNRYPKFSKLVKVNSFPHCFHLNSNVFICRSLKSNQDAKA